MTAIKLHKHFVTNGVTKARISYYLNKSKDGTPYVTIYDKEYGDNLVKIFSRADGYQNGTEIETDYFEHGCIKFFPGHALYSTALKFCEPIFLKELDHEISKRSRYGSAVEVILQSMALDLVKVFDWDSKAALQRISA